MIELFVISIVACSAGIAGFVSGLFSRKVIEKKIRDSYTLYLEELGKNGNKKDFDPHKAFNEAWDEEIEKINHKNP